MKMLLILIWVLLSTSFCSILIPKRIPIGRNSCTNLIIYYDHIISVMLTFHNTQQVFVYENQSLIRNLEDELNHEAFTLCLLNVTESQETLELKYTLKNNNTKAHGKVVLDIDDAKKNQAKKLEIKKIASQGRYVEIMLSYPSNIGTIHYGLNFKETPFENGYDLKNAHLMEYYQKSAWLSRGMQSIKYLQFMQRTTHVTLPGQVEVKKEQTILKLNELVELKSYNICLIYENKETYQYSDTVCQEFNTTGNDTMIMLYLKFKRPINDIESNYLLCFLVNYFGTKIEDVVTMMGLSCYLESPSPKNYYYSLQLPKQLAKQMIVFISKTNDQNRNQDIQRKLKQMFGQDNKISQQRLKTFKQNKVDWIENISYLGKENVGDMINNNIQNFKNITVNWRIRDGGKWREQQIVDFEIETPFFGVFYVCVIGERNIKTPQVVQILTRNAMAGKLIYCTRFQMANISPKKQLGSVIVNSSFQISKIVYVTSTRYPRFIISSSIVHQSKYNQSKKNESSVTKQSSTTEQIVKSANNSTNSRVKNRQFVSEMKKQADNSQNMLINHKTLNKTGENSKSNKNYDYRVIGVSLFIIYLIF